MAKIHTYTLIEKMHGQELRRVDGMTAADLYKWACKAHPDHEWPEEESTLIAELGEYDPEGLEVHGEHHAGKTSLYWNRVLEAKLGPLEDRFGGLGSAVTIVADRYVELMARERAGLVGLFTVGEKNLMLNNALSTMYEPGAIIIGAVLADTEDEIDETFALYGAARAALLEKLRGLNYGQQFALVDWLEAMRGEIGRGGGHYEEPEE